MTSEYTRSVLKMVVAQICQTIGWHSINSTPLEFLVDLMQEYLVRVSKLTNQYSQVLGRTEPNLDDLGLAFRHLNIDVQELVEYVRNVDSVPCAINVPKLPVHRENHLNFLKPGSREVVTRAVHVHEHLPAMYPDTEEEYSTEKMGDNSNGSLGTEPTVSTELYNGMPATSTAAFSEDTNRTSPQVVFKRPGDPVSFEGSLAKRTKTTEEGRPLREIHSVMMTTSGFISPAREGKLPESRTPQQTRSDSPPPSSYPMVPPELKTEKKLKKIPKKVPPEGGDGTKPENKENKKKNKSGKDILFKPDKIDDSKVKKLAGMKELAKLKALKPASKTGPSTLAPSGSTLAKVLQAKPSSSPKHSKSTTSQSKTKVTEKVDHMQNHSVSNDRKEETVDKLFSEPDKQKLNIFKKISKPRDDKEKEMDPLQKVKEMNSRENSPSLPIPEHNERHLDVKPEEKKVPVHNSLPNNIGRMHPPDVTDVMDLRSPHSDVYSFNDMSPPGTPSTPKTPELNVPSTSTEMKRKRKEKTNKKKEPRLKSPKTLISPKKLKMLNEAIDSDILDRPKTPQAPEPMREPTLPPHVPFPFLHPFSSSPGLIPHPMGHPMFSKFPMPLGKGLPGPHQSIANLAMPPRFLPPPMMKPPAPPPPEDYSVPKMKPWEHDLPGSVQPFIDALPPNTTIVPVKMDRVEKAEKLFKAPPQEKKVPVPKVPVMPIVAPLPNPPPAPVQAPPAPVTLATTITPIKPSKAEKPDKKSKEHKKEKKDKLKKKKEKKEKHKDKGEKIKEKKDKSDKKEKLEKIKEKKEKKEKRKEKEAIKKLAKDEKAAEGVPKITLKLGGPTNSPRPPTPDNALLKKITIKPPKKPEEETPKREPSPELAKISALVTRPPKQKSSKRAEKGMSDAYPPSSDSSFSTDLFSNPDNISRAKKSLFKALPLREPSPTYPVYVPPTISPPPQVFYIFDSSGKQVWICPACGKQDDGSPMVGCDDCDAWYHWVCVGMQVPPADAENWYCRLCIAKKQEQHHDKKKKKRKKKTKVTA